MQQNYLDCLAELGVGGAHPGGLKLTKQLLKLEKITGSSTILDAGCGTGQTVAYLNEQYQCKITAMDINKTMIEKAKARLDSLGLKADLIHGDIGNVPSKKKQFDLILCESVIAFTDVEKTLREMNRVLKETGILLAIEMVLERDLPKEELHNLSTFYGIPCFYTVSQWERHLEDAGFKNITVQKYRPDFEQLDVEDATDFSLSNPFDEQSLEILEQHESYMKKYEGILDFRIFRAS